MTQADILRSGFGEQGAALLKEGGAEAVRPLLTRLAQRVSLYERSLVSLPGGLAAAARQDRRRRIIAVADANQPRDWFCALAGEARTEGEFVVKTCPYGHDNMSVVRGLAEFLNPRPLGLAMSFGMGDRIGLATSGHVAAGRRNPDFRMNLPQQSIREMERTRRTPLDVMNDAVFGAWVCGYDTGFGSDADHLKTPADVTACIEAGFTMMVVDPSDYVDDQVDDDPPSAAEAKYDALAGELPLVDLAGRYEGKTVSVPRPGGADMRIEFDAATFRRAVVKYGRAVAHMARMAEHTASVAADRPYEFELSVDETEKPTSLAEHYFIANELRERGVAVVSLAPRFVGDFEKGVDYKGDLAEFEASLADHVAIARHFGPYKLSVHSGSDKFAVYPIVARVTEGLFHVKTAGTSYLEALRSVGRHDGDLLREIVDFSRGCFETDRATYHISSELARVPEPDALGDGDLERVYLDEDDGRQVLHVTYGSVLTAEREDGAPRFRDRVLDCLWDHEQTHWGVLEKHLGRHIDLLSGG